MYNSLPDVLSVVASRLMSTRCDARIAIFAYRKSFRYQFEIPASVLIRVPGDLVSPERKFLGKPLVSLKFRSGDTRSPGAGNST